MAWAAAIGAAASLYSSSRRNKQEREMAANRHQTEVADLRAAGLNPILSAGGSGAPMPDVQEEVGPAVNSALTQRVVNQELQNMRSQRKLLDAQSRKEDYLGDQAQTTAVLNQRLADTNYAATVSSAHSIEQENEIRRQELSERDATQGVMRMKPGDIMNNWKDLDVGQLRQLFQGILGTANSARSLTR